MGKIKNLFLKLGTLLHAKKKKRKSDLGVALPALCGIIKPWKRTTPLPPANKSLPSLPWPTPARRTTAPKLAFWTRRLPRWRSSATKAKAASSLLKSKASRVCASRKRRAARLPPLLWRVANTAAFSRIRFNSDWRSQENLLPWNHE